MKNIKCSPHPHREGDSKKPSDLPVYRRDQKSWRGSDNCLCYFCNFIHILNFRGLAHSYSDHDVARLCYRQHWNTYDNGA
jgi:hypothetical protein